MSRDPMAFAARLTIAFDMIAETADASDLELLEKTFERMK
jgi:hypothetical protein